MSTPEAPPDGAQEVAADEAGLRLDSFLARRKLVPSASAAKRAVASGVVRVNGKPAKKGIHLQPGDLVDLGQEAAAGDDDLWQATTAIPALVVLYSDDHVVAVHKTAGIATHPLHAHEPATLAHALVAQFPECAQASPDPREGGLAHRLDVPTSGVLLAARQQETWYRLRQALASPSCEKIYLAEVRGRFPGHDLVRSEHVLPGPRPSSFVVTAPIGRQGRHGGKVRLDAGRAPLPARTEIDLIEQRPDTALVEARICRGRAHQIRAHLSLLGTPVVGDSLYGAADEPADLHLHAWSVALLHPITNQPLRIQDSAPSWAEKSESPARD